MALRPSPREGTANLDTNRCTERNRKPYISVRKGTKTPTGNQTGKQETIGRILILCSSVTGDYSSKYFWNWVGSQTSEELGSTRFDLGSVGRPSVHTFYLQTLPFGHSQP